MEQDPNALAEDVARLKDEVAILKDLLLKVGNLAVMDAGASRALWNMMMQYAATSDGQRHAIGMSGRGIISYLEGTADLTRQELARITPDA